MITDRLDVPRAAFERETGWAIKPQGACKGDVCVPLPTDIEAAGRVDLARLAERLAMPVIHDQPRGVYALGPESLNGHVLTSAEAPELSLPNLDGDVFNLSSLRGQKVLIVAWAPY